MRPFTTLALVALVLAMAVSPASADFPWNGTGGDDTDPYAYWNYMFIDPAQFPPSDLSNGDPTPAEQDSGDLWKYSSETACDLYTFPDWESQNCSPAVNANPQELFGVTGASIDLAWETTTGRPDVVIAVHDSGVRWHPHRQGELTDLVNKTWLNRGELPLPGWGAPHPNDPYDRNGDGIFNIKDYCSDPTDELDCGGTGDATVRGAPGTADTDYNGNDWIDPEDLIFKFSDGVDDDGNGYVDDFVGWDSYEDDNDPFDEVDYGHGSGEARDSTAEVNNGGDAGVCPNCLVMHMRVGDSFIADVNDFAEGVVYATDNGASVIQSALGTLNNSRFAQEAIDYAYRRGVVLIASAADESAGHHNQPSVLEHGVTVNSIGEPPGLPPGPVRGTQPPSYLDFRGCTNYGAYITAAVPSNSCSSEATGRSSGMAGLIYSAARNKVAQGVIADYGALDGSGGVPVGRALSAEEVDQIVATTADDLNFITPTDYTARTGFPVPTERYPATAGWDSFFGYGRVNAERMVRAVAENKIPPEADITSPVWFAIIDPDSGPIEIEGAVASRRSDKYSYAVSWGLWSWRSTNAAPSYTTAGVTLTNPGDQTASISGLLATIDTAQVEAALAALNGPVGAADGPAVDPATGRGDHENLQYPDKFSVVVQLAVTAKDGAGTPLTDIDGDPLTGVGTKNFFLHDDPALFPGYPADLEGDGAASPRFADLDNDGQDELLVATSNGQVHAYEQGGGEVPGWPVTACDINANYGAPAYLSSEITTPVHATVLRSPTVGDISRDGDLEVAIGDAMGCVSVFDRHGQMLPGFPVRSNPLYSQPQRAERAAGYYAANPALVPGDYPGPGSASTICSSATPNCPDLVPDIVNRKDRMNRTIRWMIAAPSFGNIDPSDDDLEILAGAADRHLYAFKSDGSAVPGWPVILRDPAKLGAGDSIDPLTHRLTETNGPDQRNGAKVIVSPAVGDIDGDGTLEVIATVNEQYLEPINSDDSAIADVVDQAGTTPGNQRVYAIYPDGSLHGSPPGAPHPHSNAYLPGWPVRIGVVTLELLPVVGNGPDGAPVIANVNGGVDLEIGIFGTAGPAYILNSDGDSIYGKDPQGRDRTLLMDAPGAGSNSPDTPSVPAVAGGIFSDLLGTGQVVFAAPAAGLGKLVEVALPEDQLVSDNHLSVWELGGSRIQIAAYPREVNDLQFLATAASADIDGDGLEELLEGTAYSDLHALNFTGAEPGLATLSPTGWPKFTGGWTVGPPAVGDFNGDGLRDIAHTIREGRLFVWQGNGAAVCDPASWPEYGHDGWNSNNFETDAQRPRAITDLAADLSAEELRWTAPGDDGVCGQAQAYDLRHHASPVTLANWDDATPISGEPTPAPAGSMESVPVPSLPPGIRYFAVQAMDDSGNRGGLSNVVAVCVQGDGSLAPPDDPACAPPTPTPCPDTDGDTVCDNDDADRDGDGCRNVAELQTASGSETSGGRRDPTNPWDYFNPTKDGKNRVDDILAIVDNYFQDDNDGNPGLPPYALGYTPQTDRTLLGPNDWNLGPPNGQQRVDDIMHQIDQYFHDCS